MESTGTTFPMLWSDSSEVWRHFAVTSNSDVWLVDKDGNHIDSSLTPFEDSHIGAHIANLS